MAEQPKLPEQFKLYPHQERFHESAVRRQIVKGPLKDTKALLAAQRKMRDHA